MIHCYQITCYFTFIADKWALITSEWRVLKLRTEERPPDMEGSFEYTEKAIASSRQGVVLQLGGWEKCKQLLAVKNCDVSKYITRSLNWTCSLVRHRNRGRWWALVHVVMNLWFP